MDSYLLFPSKTPSSAAIGKVVLTAPSAYPAAAGLLDSQVENKLKGMWLNGMDVALERKRLWPLASPPVVFLHFTVDSYWIDITETALSHSNRSTG